MIKSSQSGDLGRFFIDRKYLTDEGRRETDAEYRDRINQDLRLSKYVLESELNTVVNYFAYPYGVTNGGSYDARFLVRYFYFWRRNFERENCY